MLIETIIEIAVKYISCCKHGYPVTGFHIYYTYIHTYIHVYSHTWWNQFLNLWLITSWYMWTMLKNYFTSSTTSYDQVVYTIYTSTQT